MLNKNSKVYIAGHKGFVGSHIYSKFKYEQFKNIITRTRNELDLTNQRKVDNFIKKEKPHYVIMAAAKVVGIGANVEYPSEFLYENLAIQNNLIWSAHKYKVKKLLFLGSSCIYPRLAKQPMKEEYMMTGSLEPTNEGYAVAKIAGLKLCEYLHRQYNNNFISIMPCNLYGPGDSFDPKNSHVISALIHKFVEAKRGKKRFVEVWGTGKPRREFLYVEDLADATYFLMENYNKPNFINVGTGEDISIKNLAILIRKLVKFDGELVFNSKKPDGMPRKLMDISRLSNTGWTSKTNLKEGLMKTIVWFEKNF